MIKLQGEFESWIFGTKESSSDTRLFIRINNS